MRLNLLLEEVFDTKYKEVNSFAKKLIKYKKHLSPFYTIIIVPADKNSSERAIRKIKVKQKMSGQFRSLNGVQLLAVIRSVIDTLIKRWFNNLQLIADPDLSSDENAIHATF